MLNMAMIHHAPHCVQQRRLSWGNPAHVPPLVDIPISEMRVLATCYFFYRVAPAIQNVGLESFGLQVLFGCHSAQGCWTIWYQLPENIPPTWQGHPVVSYQRKKVFRPPSNLLWTCRPKDQVLQGHSYGQTITVVDICWGYFAHRSGVIYLINYQCICHIYFQIFPTFRASHCTGNAILMFKRTAFLDRIVEHTHELIIWISWFWSCMQDNSGKERCPLED